MSTLKIAIIGYGRVGSQVASLLSTCNAGEFDVTIIDPSEEVEGSVLDTSSAFAGAGIDVQWSNDTPLSQFDFIFYCAGPWVPANGDRMAVCAESLELVNLIFQGQELSPSAFVISLSNPLDVVSHHIWKCSGLPPGQVIGTGTLLDTYRVQMLIAAHLKVSVRDVDCLVLGEHGHSMVATWDTGAVNGAPLAELLSEADIETLQEELVTMARTIKKTQDATYFGVARCAFEIFKALISEDEITVPVSVYLDQIAEVQLNTTPLFMSWPCRIGMRGVRVQQEVSLSQRELEALRLSARKILKYH